MENRSDSSFDNYLKIVHFGLSKAFILTFAFLLSFNCTAQHKKAEPLNTNQGAVVYVSGTEASESKTVVRDIAQLEATIKVQDANIASLKSELSALQKKSSNGMSFEVWTGILLACIALLLTVMGIGLGVLSFFGYKKILAKSAESAEQIAAQIAKLTSEATTHDVVREELFRLIEDNRFDDIIGLAVERFSYRGLTPLADLDNNKA